MGNTTTKSDIVQAVQEQTGFSPRVSENIVVAVFETVGAELERGSAVKLSRFGNFAVRRKKARPGRNPKTGEDSEISERTVLLFRPSVILRNRVEQG